MDRHGGDGKKLVDKSTRAVCGSLFCNCSNLKIHLKFGGNQFWDFYNEFEFTVK